MIHRPSLGVAIALLLGSVLLVHLYGVVPGLVRSLPSTLQLIGRIECGAESLSWLFRFNCPLVGGEAGGVFQSNVAVTFFAVGLVRMGLDAAWAVAAVYYVAALAGLWGAYRLVRALGVPRPIALGAAFLFFASTTVLGMLSFGGLVVGLLSTFFAVAIELIALDAARHRLVKRAIASSIAFTGASLVVVFSDGYAFMMFAMLSAVIGLMWALHNPKARETWLAIGSYVLSLAIAYGLFNLVPRAGQWARSDIELFRAMGLDPATLFIPSQGLWWAELTGVTVRSDLLWGDGSNSAHNYLGFGVLIMAMIGIALRQRGSNTVLVALVIVIVVALVLALGPSLKWYAIRGELAVPVTYESYLMPAESALFDLPTKWIYETVPGFEFMRATYRWMALVRFGVLALAALGVWRLWQRRRSVAVIALTIAIAEITVDLPHLLADAKTQATWQYAFDRDVTHPMDADLAHGARVLFTPNAVGDNDFLVNYLAPAINVWTYNVGSDKALERARALWPELVAELLAADKDPMSTESLDLAAQVLDKHVDVIIVPFFDLRWSSYQWPAEFEYVQRGEQAANAYAADPRFDIERRGTYAIVTLSQG